jgi:C4-dicarboxylate transporter DctM subunit
MTASALFILLFLFMFMGMPIAIALGLSSIITILVFTNDTLATTALKLFEANTAHYTLLAIPFFILSSQFLSTGGVARRLIRFATAAVGFVRGGMAMASVMACMLFAAVSGSSPATVAAIGGIVIGGMVKSGFPKSFAAGVIANAGTLGILIPPSIVMLVYSAATDVSAARMFMAGVVPGIGIGVVLMVAIYIFATVKKMPRQPFVGFAELVRSGLSASGGLFMILLVLGIIYGGVASPTEAAALSAVYAYFIAVFIYRDMGPLKKAEGKRVGPVDYLLALPRSVVDAEVRHVLLDAAKVSIMLLFIITNAMLFAHVLTAAQIPQTIAGMITDLGLPAWGFLIVVNILLLIAGNFMEPSAILLIMAPILLPIALSLGIDPVHFGIVMVVNMEIGMITPPVGLNLFVTAGITNQSIMWVVKAALPWLLILLACLIVITYVPEIALFLPNSMMGASTY